MSYVSVLSIFQPQTPKFSGRNDLVCIPIIVCYGRWYSSIPNIIKTTNLT